jgi:hypothetical protein
VASLIEVETMWSLEDIAAANEVLDIVEDARAEALAQARRDAERRR